MSQLVPFEHQLQIAKSIAASKLFGIQTADQALALMAIAQAEGMHPAIAARDYHIINGKPTLKADAMLARFQQAGGTVKWKRYDDEAVTGIFAHPQGGELELTWTMEQAKRVGLARNPTWGKYPRAMLRARCISEGIRTVFPGGIVGVYTPEEAECFDEVEIVTPEPAKAEPPTITPAQAKEITDMLPHYAEDGHPHKDIVIEALKHFKLSRCLDLRVDQLNVMKTFISKRLEVLDDADHTDDN